MSGPPPPSDLAARQITWVELAAGETIHRFYERIWPPIYFDQSLKGRLNAPDGTYGVLYTAKTARGAFAETFLRTPGRQTLDPSLFTTRACVRLQVVRDLRLVHFDGPDLGRLGATAAVTHGDPPYDNAQAWSAALKAHPSAADGIAYTSRHDPNELCYALFDAAATPVVETVRLTDLDQDWFWDLAGHYRVGLPPSTS